VLEGIARTEGVNYQQIVLALDLGLQQTMKSGHSNLLCLRSSAR